MKTLIICIELLFGHYFIEINPDYIVTYWTEEGIETKREINLIDIEEQMLYAFDEDRSIRYSSLTEVENLSPEIADIIEKVNKK